MNRLSDSSFRNRLCQMVASPISLDLNGPSDNPINFFLIKVGSPRMVSFEHELEGHYCLFGHLDFSGISGVEDGTRLHICSNFNDDFLESIALWLRSWIDDEVDRESMMKLIERTSM